MPPKRSSSSRDGEKDARSPKRSKTTPPSKRGSPKSRRGTKDDGNDQTVPVSWAWPEGDSNLAGQYAQTLYHRGLNRLEIVQETFGFPRIRIPIFRNRGKDLTRYSDDNRSGQAVCELFNTIKKDTTPLRKGQEISGPIDYPRIKFVTALQQPNNPAVVASGSTGANCVLALTEDYTVRVTVHEGDNDDPIQSAQLHFIRRSPTTAGTSNTPVANHDYFIELPPETRVTVNGDTYINKRGRNRSDDELPFIIGPLTRYTVIELLAQPIFFFRTPEDLDYKGRVIKGARARPSSEELENRSPDIDEGSRVEIVWSTATSQDLSAPSPPAPPKLASPKLPSPKPPQPGQPHENPLQPNPSQPTPPQTKPAQKNEAQRVPTIPPGPAPRALRDDPVEYDDRGFAYENGEPITNPAVYVHQRLGRGFGGDAPLHGINAVLLGINDRQGAWTGFSVALPDTVLRPGRPLLIPYEVTENVTENYFVLLVFQVTESRDITLYVLDPLCWDSRQQDRQLIVDQAINRLRSSNWLTKVIGKGVDVVSRLQPAQWVPCPQTVHRFITPIYAVLNAWALAMGSFPLPRFFLPGEREDMFLCESLLLIRAVTEGIDQDWRTVLAFFRKWQYVQNFETAIPLPNRQFDQSKRTVEDLLARQRREDLQQRSTSGTVDIQGMVELKLKFSGVYNTPFPADGQSRSGSAGIVRPLVRAGLWRPDMTMTQLIAAHADLSASRNRAGRPTPTQPRVPGQSGAGKSAPPNEPTVAPPHPPSPSRKGSKSPPQPPPQQDPQLSPRPQQPDPRSPFRPPPQQDPKPPDGRVPHQPRQSTKELESDITPCVYLQHSLRKLLKSPDVMDKLADLREGEEKVSMAENIWLLQTEVSLAIACVTQAITAMQPLTGGFSTIYDDTVTDIIYDTPLIAIDPVIRFGRPLLFPMTHYNHIVLFVIQFEPEQGLTISVVDSRAHHHDQARRVWMFEAARKLIRKTKWARHPHGTSEEPELPDHALWIPTANQVKDYACGWYAIFNAWALALGLELNLDFAPVWSSFHKDACAVVHLARIGRADWKLIWSFLRCHRFVHDGEIPSSRRFRNTMSLRNSRTHQNYIETMRVYEDNFWSKQQNVDQHVLEMRAENWIDFFNAERRRHDAVFQCDKWDESVDRVDGAGYLAEIGRLRCLVPSKILNACRETYQISDSKTAHENQGSSRARRFMNSNIPEIGKISVERLLSRYADCVLSPGAQQGNSERIIKRACSVRHEGFKFLETLMDDEKIQSILVAKHLPTDWRKGLEEEVVYAAIASVVQALDSHQLGTFQKEYGRPFNGGFSLATFNNIMLARMPDFEAGENTYMSRPRRCWFLPLTVSAGETHAYKKEKGLPSQPSKGNRAHTFLVVIQEMEKERGGDSQREPDTEFIIHFLDSARHVFQFDQAYLSSLVETIATTLKWTRHRNPLGRKKEEEEDEEPIVEFCAHHYIVAVSQQPEGFSKACGYHTILNAWILAMGLTPSERNLTKSIYVELNFLVRVAILGLLDWQTLVAWLFCNNLVVEPTTTSFETSRRFGVTVFQGSNEDQLEKHIADVHINDDNLLEQLDSGFGNKVYDFQNNIECLSEESEARTAAVRVNVATGEEIFFKFNREEGEEKKREGEEPAEDSSLGSEGEEEENEESSSHLGSDLEGDDLKGFKDPEEEEESALNRAYDDTNRGFIQKRSQRRRTAPRIRDRSLRFLDNLDADGDMQMTGTKKSFHVRLSRPLDRLSFLDAY